jgi:PilZ domain-containing protein
MTGRNHYKNLSEQAAAIVAEFERAITQLCQAADREADAAIERARAEGAADVEAIQDIKQAELESEIHNRMSLVAELQAVNEKLLQARAEGAALRLQLERATKRAGAVATTSAPAANSGAPVDAICAALEALRTAMNQVSGARSGTNIVPTVVQAFGARFSRVVLCGAESRGFVVWKSFGFDPALQPKTVLAIDPDSVLAKAAANWETTFTASPDGSTHRGMLHERVRYTIALPLVAKGRGTALLYAENLPDAGSAAEDVVSGKIGEIIAEYVRSRLNIKQTAGAADQPAQTAQRKARRVKMLDGTVIIIDNMDGTLVDLSSLGAQVVSSSAIKPNSAVRLILPTEAGGITCEARVVWVNVERNTGSRSPIYRAGMQFTDVKTGELDGFLGFLDTPVMH